MKLRPMLQVSDVEASSRWYQEVLGLRSGHGGDEFEMLFSDDEFVLQLHRIDGHEHGLATPPTDGGPAGAGVSLWFGADADDAFRAAVERARSLGARILTEPAWNPLAHHHEATLEDPDGYAVVVHGPFVQDESD